MMNARRKKLEGLAWKLKHADFKGRLPDGTRTVLRMNPKTGGTEMVPLMGLTGNELLDMIGPKYREGFEEFETRKLEAEGMSRGDAQGVLEAELMQTRQK